MVQDRVQDKDTLRKFSPKNFFCKKPLNVMFGGEIVEKKSPFKKNFVFGKFLIQDRVQDKVRLRKCSPKIFFCKKPLNVMFDGEIVRKKNFALRKFLVQDRVQDKVQDKVGLGKFSPKKSFFCKKP